MSSSAALVAVAVNREAAWTRTRGRLRLGQYIRYGGYFLANAAIGKQSTLQKVGKDLLRYLVLACQLALIQLKVIGVGATADVLVSAFSVVAAAVAAAAAGGT